MAAERLSDDILSELEQICERRQFHLGETITVKGEKHDAMYFILTGWVQIEFLEARSGTSTLRVGERSVLGEMGFLSGENAVATAMAVSPVTALEVDNRALEQLEARNPQAAAEFSDYLAKTIDSRLSSRNG